MVDLRPFRSLHAIVLVRELLRRWWGLELALADARGEAVDLPLGSSAPAHNEMCQLALVSAEGARRCAESVRAVATELRAGAPEAGSAVVRSCHLGFHVVAAPIWAGGELAGYLYTRGSWPADVNADVRTEATRAVRELAASDGGPDPTASVPRLGPEDLERVRELIAYGAGEIAQQIPSQRAPVAAIEAGGGHPFSEIVGRSPAVRDVIRLLAKVVKSESTVLVQGESGTGKELIARAIHYHGPRAKKPFVVQNCSAFNDNLLESALFGHVRGAFTGAVKDQKGLFEVADGGTFFLDEIGDMSAALQVKLLRVLQESTFMPVGGTKPVKVDVRIIAASHKDLAAMVARREFREDLFYRINVIKVTVPPLRERGVDIPMLADHFLLKHYRAQRPGSSGAPPRLSDRALELLIRYPWPGNIRELENEIERLLVLGGDGTEIAAELLSPRLRATDEVPAEGPRFAGTLREVTEQVEAELILHRLMQSHWNRAQVAKELGISVAHLAQKCAYYSLERKE